MSIICIIFGTGLNEGFERKRKIIVEKKIREIKKTELQLGI
jgi:hexokinase